MPETRAIEAEATRRMGVNGELEIGDVEASRRVCCTGFVLSFVRAAARATAYMVNPFAELNSGGGEATSTY